MTFDEKKEDAEFPIVRMPQAEFDALPEYIEGNPEFIWGKCFRGAAKASECLMARNMCEVFPPGLPKGVRLLEWFKVIITEPKE